MTLKRILTTAVCLLVPALAWAAGENSGGVTVRSNPSGAMVSLHGTVVVSGVTPVRFQHALDGEFVVEASKPGYETSRSRVSLDPRRADSILVVLKRKTRAKTALRSAIIPGWGQRYTDRPGRGWAYLALTAVAGATFLVADADFNGKYHDYRQRWHRYAAAPTVDEQRALWPGVSRAQARAYDAEDFRITTIGMVLGVWGLNVLDALVLFPKHGDTFTVKTLTAAPIGSPQTVGLSLSISL